MFLFASIAKGQSHADTSKVKSSEDQTILTNDLQDVVEIHVWHSRYGSIGGDSLWISRNLTSDLGRAMAKDGRVAVFQYGPPGTACVLRSAGLSPDHSELNYSGFSMNSLTLGMADLSMLPSFFFDGFSAFQNPPVGFQTQSALGNAVALYVNNNIRPNKVSYWTEYSSLNNFSQGLQWRHSFLRKKKSGDQRLRHWIEWKAAHQMFKNQFEYAVPTYLGEKWITQNDNDVQQTAQMLTWKTEMVNGYFNVQYWNVQRNAQLPVLIGQEFSNQSQTQDDVQHRLMVNFKRKNSTWFGGMLSAEAGGFGLSDHQKYLHYYGEILNERSVTETQQWFNYANIYWTNTKLDCHYRVQNRSVRVGFNEGASIDQQIPSLYTAHQWRMGQTDWMHTIKINTQWDYWQDQGLNERYTLDFRSHYSKYRYELEVGASPFYVERVPDFNERFWPGSGNPNLLPEVGHGAKLYWNQSWHTGNSSSPNWEWLFDQDLTFRRVNNWIQWVPRSNGLWQPQNWKYVEAFEYNANLKLNKSFQSLRWGTVMSLQHLNNRSWKISEKVGEGDLLPYSPRWRGSFETDFTLKNGLFVQFNCRYIGERSMNENQDAGSVLPAVQLMDLKIGGPIPSMPRGSYWQIGCDNFANVSYQEVKGYALPGRVWNVMIKIEIQ
ncbi:MAG: hypothetical protein RL106_1182 [Bacteroidota bacterium]